MRRSQSFSLTQWSDGLPFLSARTTESDELYKDIHQWCRRVDSFLQLEERNTHPLGHWSADVSAFSAIIAVLSTDHWNVIEELLLLLCRLESLGLAGEKSEVALDAVLVAASQRTQSCFDDCVETILEALLAANFWQKAQHLLQELGEREGMEPNSQHLSLWVRHAMELLQATKNQAMAENVAGCLLEMGCAIDLRGHSVENAIELLRARLRQKNKLARCIRGPLCDFFIATGGAPRDRSRIDNIHGAVLELMLAHEAKCHVDGCKLGLIIRSEDLKKLAMREALSP